MRDVLVRVVHRFLDLRADPRLLREGGEPLEGDAVLLGPGRRHVGVDHDECRHVGAAVSDDAGLADERMQLQDRLDVSRRDVLPTGRDNELLLPIDDPNDAVAIDGRDVSRVQPPVVCEGLPRGLGVAVVAGTDVPAPDQELAILQDALLDPDEGGADGPQPDVLGASDVGEAGGLGHPVPLLDRDADAVEELQDVHGDGRRPGGRKEDTVQTDPLADLRTDQPVERGPSQPDPHRNGAPGLLEPNGLPSDLDGPKGAANAPRIPARIFSHTRGGPANAVGRTSGTMWITSAMSGHMNACPARYSPKYMIIRSRTWAIGR